MQIGQLAARTGVLVDTIRYYEQVGLIARAPRTKSGYRLYQPEHLRRLIFIRPCRALGFSINEIRSLINLSGYREQRCTIVTSMAEQHLVQVGAKRADLDRLDQALSALIASCVGGRVANCKFLEALSHSGH